MGYWGRYPKYVPIADRQAKAKKEMEKLRKKGKSIHPIELNGRTIARSFWGKAWCDHLESFSDYANRLHRGRAYVRNGSVCHLEVKPGLIEALVCGSSLYKITVKIKPLGAEAWKAVIDKCRGQIGSILELLQGQFSHHVMSVVSNRESGLFPKPKEISLDCSCPDWATMCKHVAAVLYGVGSRLDTQPELLFVLRQVDASELISAEINLPESAKTEADSLSDDSLAAIFGIEMDAPQSSESKHQATRLDSSIAQQNEGIPQQTKGKVSSRKTQKPGIRRSKQPPRQTRTGKVDNKGFTGSGIKRLRKQTGLSVKDFAKSVGVTEASISRWERSTGILRIQAKPLAALTSLKANNASIPTKRAK